MFRRTVKAVGAAASAAHRRRKTPQSSAPATTFQRTKRARDNFSDSESSSDTPTTGTSPHRKSKCRRVITPFGPPKDISALPELTSKTDQQIKKTSMDRTEDARVTRGITSGTGEPIWRNKHGKTYPNPVQIMSDSEKSAWLSSAQNWQTFPLGIWWRGVKILGIGTYGLVGLWENLNWNPESGTPRMIVVKQSKGADFHLMAESMMLKMCGETGTKHIVGLVREYHDEWGMGTSEWDRGDREVCRIYLEFCENGDMDGFIKQMTLKYSREDPMPEEVIWSIWECLAKGLCVLAHGNEDLTGPNHMAWDESIGHFDLKPENILIGTHDANHPKYEIFKIADLGLSKFIPSIQTPSWMESIGTHGTRLYLPPEQIAPTRTPNRILGTPGSIWQLAKCMYELLKRGRTFHRSMVREIRIDGESEFFATFGEKIWWVEGYSMRLKLLILKCLAVDPSRRPTPREVLRDCRLALSTFEENGMGLEMGDISAFGEGLNEWQLPARTLGTP